jgi:hypothetical protein
VVTGDKIWGKILQTVVIGDKIRQGSADSGYWRQNMRQGSADSGYWRQNMRQDSADSGYRRLQTSPPKCWHISAILNFLIYPYRNRSFFIATWAKDSVYLLSVRILTHYSSFFRVYVHSSFPYNSSLVPCTGKEVNMEHVLVRNEWKV